MTTPKAKALPLLGATALVGVLAVGLVLDRPGKVQATSTSSVPAAPPESDGQQLKKLYFPSHPEEKVMPALDGLSTNGVDLRVGSGFVDKPVEEVYFWYLENLQGDDRDVGGQLRPDDVSYVTYITKDEPFRPKTLTLVPDGKGTMVLSSAADAKPMFEPGQMPPDLPAPPGATGVLAIKTADTHRMYRFVMPGDAKAVESFYRDALPKAGWKEQPSLPVPTRAGVVLSRFERAGQLVQVMVTGETSGGVGVFLTLMGQDALEPPVATEDAEEETY